MARPRHLPSKTPFVAPSQDIFKHIVSRLVQICQQADQYNDLLGKMMAEDIARASDNYLKLVLFEYKVTAHFLEPEHFTILQVRSNHHVFGELRLISPEHSSIPIFSLSLGQQLADICGWLLQTMKDGKIVRFSRTTVSTDSVALVATLSAREREILRLMTYLYTTEEIAQQLHVSKRTVQGHKQHIYAQLQVKSWQAAVRIGQVADLEL